MLAEVVVALMASTAPQGSEDSVEPSEKNGAPGGEVAADEGAYSKLLEQFSTWIAWVQEVWDARQEPRTRLNEATGYLTTQNFTETLSISTTGGPGISPYTPIDALGDTPKAALRSLSQHLTILAGRLEEARGLPFQPINSPPVSSSHTPRTTDSAAQPPTQPSMSTPELVWNLTNELLDGMREELQLMREIECEVMLGEEAWLERGVRRVGEVGWGV